MRFAVFVCVVLVASVVCARRSGGGGSRRGGSGYSSSRRGSSSSSGHRSPPAVVTGSDGRNHFLNAERASSSSGSTHNRGNPFSNPPKPAPAPQQTGQIGFEKFGSSNQGNKPLGFDKVNSEAANRPGVSHTPSAPPYQGGSHIPSVPQHPPNVPPPAYYPGSGNAFGGAHEHPPAYPGRPVNAPPSYPGNTHFNPSQQGFGNNPGQGYYGQQGNPNSGHFGNAYPQNQFGNNGHGSYQAFGSYPSNTGSYPGHGGGIPMGNSYQGNTFGGSPFGNAGYNGNPYYSPMNFGYSSNPGYFGSQGGHSGFPGQYNNNYHKSSGFGSLPIPIPIPIPIPFGGGGFGGHGGFGGFGGGYGGGYGGNGDYSYRHRVLDTFIRGKSTPKSNNASTSVFILNNSTVLPCTTDHFVYDLLKVSVTACTSDFCTAIKVSTATNTTEPSVHEATFTMCLENNVTFSYHSDKVTPTVSEMQRETLTVCRDVPNNATAKTANATTEVNTTITENVTTTLPPVAEEATMTVGTTVQDTPTTTPSLLNSTVANSSKVCEAVNCTWVEMCLPAIEVVDECNEPHCPFRRTGFKTCLTTKMCRSPSSPDSVFASLNTTISKIDEHNRHNSVHDTANLTLISYHPPQRVISFNCTQNSTAPGCPPTVSAPPQPQQGCLPSNSSVTTQSATASTPSSINATLCSPAVSSTTSPADLPVVASSSSSPPP